MHQIAQPIAILVRMLAVAFLIGSAYNPSGYSYYHWILDGPGGLWAVKTLLGLGILIGFIFCVAATARSLGLLFSVPLAIVIGAAIWVLVHFGLIDLSDGTQRILTFEIALIVLLGTGVSFSLIRYRLSGQLDSRTLA